jgi:hypothetical protein
VNAQTKAYVFPVAARVGETDLIKRSIMEGGCLLICSDKPPEIFHTCVTDSHVLVLLICPETASDPLVAQAADLAAQLGRRIVGVWSESSDGTVPPSLHKHGDALIRLAAADLARAVCGGETSWVDLTGEALAKPPTPRHKARKK